MFELELLKGDILCSLRDAMQSISDRRSLSTAEELATKFEERYRE